MSETILFVDTDDTNMKRLPEPLTEKNPPIQASSYREGIDVLTAHPKILVAVVNVDMNPQEAEAFLHRLKKQFSKIVLLALTSKSDFDMACMLINEIGIHRIIKAPCEPNVMANAIIHGLRHHKREHDRHRTTRDTLLGSVQALVDILDLVNPEAVGYAKRIEGRVKMIGKAMEVRPLWQLELAVKLSHVGCIALPSDIMEKMEQGDTLSPEEQQIFDMHPLIASNLLSNINQMVNIARIIENQLAPAVQEPPLESRIIKVALDLEKLEHKGAETIAILNGMKAKPKMYDIGVVNATLKLMQQSQVKSVVQISVQELKEGMVIAKTLVNKAGVKLLLRGQPVSKASLIRLKAFHDALGVVDRIHVYNKTA